MKYIKIENNYGFYVIPVDKILWIRKVDKDKEDYEVVVSVGMGSKDFTASADEILTTHELHELVK